MELIFGTLAINLPELTSLLEPNNVWLLLAGFPDPNQAGHAATNFIVNVRHLSDGPVAVTGTRNTIGTQPVIIMTDINAAGALMEHAMRIQGKASSLTLKSSGTNSEIAEQKSSRKRRSKTAKAGDRG